METFIQPRHGPNTTSQEKQLGSFPEERRRCCEKLAKLGRHHHTHMPLYMCSTTTLRTVKVRGHLSDVKCNEYKHRSQLCCILWYSRRFESRLEICLQAMIGYVWSRTRQRDLLLCVWVHRR
eukprot:scpid15753/ scgid23014/ 